LGQCWKQLDDGPLNLQPSSGLQVYHLWDGDHCSDSAPITKLTLRRKGANMGHQDSPGTKQCPSLHLVILLHQDTSPSSEFSPSFHHILSVSYFTQPLPPHLTQKKMETSQASKDRGWWFWEEVSVCPHPCPWGQSHLDPLVMLAGFESHMGKLSCY
jgi:hypothetical protein